MPAITITRPLRGQGPGSCAGGRECVDTVTDLSGGAPYAYDLTGLESGVPVFARVKAHNALSYGPGAYPAGALYAIPANVAPGAPPRPMPSARSAG